VNTLYRITFDDFCDWYLEAIKPRLYEKDEDALATGLAALERLLKLLHPVMPHVTEEIWSNLPDRPSRLIVAEWPGADPRFVDFGSALVRVQDAAAIFRRSQVQVELDPEERRIFEAVVRPERVKANGNAKLEIDRLRKEVERSQRMLGNERFVANAAPEVVDAEREKLERYERELRALEGLQS
jgi:valyl-tRNA synthetase